MLKLIGASIILFSTTFTGLKAAGRLARRPVEIRQLQTALKLLQTEIVYGATPLSQALDHIAKRISGSVGKLFSMVAGMLNGQQELTVYQSFETAAAEIWPTTAMKQPEKEILLQLGGILGLSDREDQKRHIELALMNLQSEEKHSLDQQSKYEKLYKSMGLLSGLLVIILLY
ncbi:stage III sporulation protein SpoIIIAB [Aneurinibacillus sp. Ricciae_BoGa-3]|uniref:stage III sporulation protein SpoIIIAB n=1 Tax=Aneurinibacillus sp. Ricciae_BoGa-3 TaxID=3022697 RepID=UPI002341CA60|nr:stage III sporulation protein SpoIIIAB [Aneurinibacillus sp. Ricciae_BoGa-3]WCK53153.1 stage III sporulation protein SpoIIIAB [Aneurinibacillus sp. Ricciae_BoGa-3]